MNKITYPMTIFGRERDYISLLGVGLLDYSWNNNEEIKTLGWNSGWKQSWAWIKASMCSDSGIRHE